MNGMVIHGDWDGDWDGDSMGGDIANNGKATISSIFLVNGNRISMTGIGTLHIF